ncbi:DNA mismatch repair endonuclease MutL [Thermoclostridium stercorarium]|uniref:DNA mismatch repair endonuclease MutL n=1 Tax=Thermoclostridium stercorarium TaxID=1510 RepID=UPI000B196E1D|nr:DNA mismatch repair endonuclease MutL [Thermoclostridium stercorarium]
MGKVVILDENTANQIAAGEVIERPASVVKEMVENAIDAHATSITVEITNGGVKSIKIVDNGDGIEGDDVELAFERHATSKIRSIDDLTRLSTMGFRGEALASIAAVSKVEVITKTEDAKTGTRVIVEGGKVVLSEPTGAPKGTTFIVRELFYNTPARYKFLKKDTTEATYIHDVISKIALARPDISIKFVNQGKTVIHTPGNHDLLSTVYSLFGKDTARAVIPVNLTFNGVKVSGFVGKPEISRGNRNLEMVFVNGRVVYNRTIITAIEEAYKTRLMQKRFPFTVLKVDVPPETVDVNVHPAKLEVRFSDENMVYRTVYMAVSDALSGASLIQSIEEEDGSEIFSFGEVNIENKLSRQKCS